ncbi:transposase, partial [Helicobacter pylori]|nr:transposase [Helicobacter pylori]
LSKGLSLFGVGNIHADFKEQNLSLVSVGIF